jgi:hypothetical protein
MNLAELLRPFDISEDEFLDVLKEALAARPFPLAALTKDESGFLETFGGIHRPSSSDRDERRHVALASLGPVVALVHDSITVRELANRLRADESRIRHRIGDRALYARKMGRQLRLPLWQFDDDGQPIPGLRAVLTALPEGLHPLEVAGFMTNPQPELDVEDTDVSPREWLLAGGDVTAVVSLAEGINEW